MVSGGAVWWTLTRWRQVWCVCSVTTVWSIPDCFRGENGALYKLYLTLPVLIKHPAETVFHSGKFWYISVFQWMREIINVHRNCTTNNVNAEYRTLNVKLKRMWSWPSLSFISCMSACSELSGSTLSHHTHSTYWLGKKWRVPLTLSYWRL